MKKTKINMLVAVILCAFCGIDAVCAARASAGRPDPSGTVVSTAALFDHSEQGGLRWKIADDAAAADVTFVGVTDEIDSKPALSYDPDAHYAVAFVIEYQSKQVDSMPIPGFPTCYLAGVKVHPDAGTAYSLPIVPVYPTDGVTWAATQPMPIPGVVSGAALNASECGVSFHAAQANDGTVYLMVRVKIVATPV